MIRILCHPLLIGSPGLTSSGDCLTRTCPTPSAAARLGRTETYEYASRGWPPEEDRASRRQRTQRYKRGLHVPGQGERRPCAQYSDPHLLAISDRQRTPAESSLSLHGVNMSLKPPLSSSSRLSRFLHSMGFTQTWAEAGRPTATTRHITCQHRCMAL